MTGPTVRRSSLPLTERDEQELALLRESTTHRNMVAQLNAVSTFSKDVSEAVMLHTVFEIGLRTVREALEEKGYAELAKQQAEEEPNKHATARRSRPSRAGDE
jgi:hypothetical protein